MNEENFVNLHPDAFSQTENSATENYNLFINKDNSWETLPVWAEFWINLGNFLTNLSLQNERAIVGVALPTRCYAATMTAVGAILGNLNKKVYSNAEDHFNFLCKLPYKTSVRILAKNGKGKDRLYNGRLLGCEEIKLNTASIPVLKVQTEKSSMKDNSARGSTHFIQIRDAHRIQLVEAENNLPDNNLPTHQKGLVVTPITDFAEKIIGSNHAANFAKNSYSTCLLVGNLGVLRKEIIDEKFGTSVKNSRENICIGNFLDLLRVRKFTSANKSFRSDAFAANSRRPPGKNQTQTPEIVIFDGSNGFLKWRDFWKSSHWVVLLDQTESGFSDAANTLNNCYRQRTGEDLIPENFPCPPEYIEIVYFQEKI
jgi:hypothetical protein